MGRDPILDLSTKGAKESGRVAPLCFSPSIISLVTSSDGFTFLGPHPSRKRVNSLLSGRYGS